MPVAASIRFDDAPAAAAPPPPRTRSAGWVSTAGFTRTGGSRRPRPASPSPRERHAHAPRPRADRHPAFAADDRARRRPGGRAPAGRPRPLRDQGPRRGQAGPAAGPPKVQRFPTRGRSRSEYLGFETPASAPRSVTSHYAGLTSSGCAPPTQLADHGTLVAADDRRRRGDVTVLIDGREVARKTADDPRSKPPATTAARREARALLDDAARVRARRDPATDRPVDGREIARKTVGLDEFEIPSRPVPRRDVEITFSKVQALPRRRWPRWRVVGPVEWWSGGWWGGGVVESFAEGPPRRRAAGPDHSPERSGPARRSGPAWASLKQETPCTSRTPRASARIIAPCSRHVTTNRHDDSARVDQRRLAGRATKTSGGGEAGEDREGHHVGLAAADHVVRPRRRRGTGKNQNAVQAAGRADEALRAEADPQKYSSSRSRARRGTARRHVAHVQRQHGPEAEVRRQQLPPVRRIVPAATASRPVEPPRAGRRPIVAEGSPAPPPSRAATPARPPRGSWRRGGTSETIRRGAWGATRRWW